MCRLLLRRTHPWPHRDGAGPGIVEGGPCRGAPTIVAAIVTRAAGATVLAFPLPLPLAFTAVVGVGQKGEGLLEDTLVPAVVGTDAAAAAKGAFHLMVQSRMWRPVPWPPSGPAQSPRVRGCCEWCGTRGTAVTA
jgi:hypothetical protein